MLLSLPRASVVIRADRLSGLWLAVWRTLNVFAAVTVLAGRRSAPIWQVKHVNPFKFAQEVREETSKVTWPTRKETWVTTVAVLIMVAVASVFFLITDQLIGWLVSTVLSLTL